MSISMYPEFAFIHIHAENEFGYEFSMCDQVSKEKALEVARQFNIQVQ